MAFQLFTTCVGFSPSSRLIAPSPPGVKGALHPTPDRGLTGGAMIAGGRGGGQRPDRRALPRPGVEGIGPMLSRTPGPLHLSPPSARSTAPHERHEIGPTWSDRTMPAGPAQFFCRNLLLRDPEWVASCPSRVVNGSASVGRALRGTEIEDVGVRDRPEARRHDQIAAAQLKVTQVIDQNALLLDHPSRRLQGRLPRNIAWHRGVLKWNRPLELDSPRITGSLNVDPEAIAVRLPLSEINRRLPAANVYVDDGVAVGMADVRVGRRAGRAERGALRGFLELRVCCMFVASLESRAAWRPNSSTSSICSRSTSWLPGNKTNVASANMFRIGSSSIDRPASRAACVPSKARSPENTMRSTDFSAICSRRSRRRLSTTRFLPK